MRIERRFTKAAGYLRGHRIPSGYQRNPQSRRLARIPSARYRSACGVDPGRVRCAGAKIFRKAGVPARFSPWSRATCPIGYGARPLTKRRLPPCLPLIATVPSAAPSRCSTAWPARGRIGAGRAAISFQKDARAYFDEMRLMLCEQMAAPNSPQWFNTGLHWAFGIDGPAQGHYYVDFRTGEIDPRRPAPTSIRSRTRASSSRSPTIW